MMFLNIFNLPKLKKLLKSDFIKGKTVITLMYEKQEKLQEREIRVQRER